MILEKIRRRIKTIHRAFEFIWIMLIYFKMLYLFEHIILYISKQYPDFERATQPIRITHIPFDSKFFGFCFYVRTLGIMVKTKLHWVESFAILMLCARERKKRNRFIYSPCFACTKNLGNDRS